MKLQLGVLRRLISEEVRRSRAEQVSDMRREVSQWIPEVIVRLVLLGQAANMLGDQELRSAVEAAHEQMLAVRQR